MDGTLLEAWAGQKSFKPKGDAPTPPPEDPGNPTVDFRGERRSNATHASTTDPDARLAKKAPGQEAKLCSPRPGPDHPGRGQDLRYPPLRHHLPNLPDHAARGPTQ